MAEKGTSGDLGYRGDEPDGSDGVDVYDQEDGDASESELDYVPADAKPREHDGFDAFDEKNWVEVLDPVRTPWYGSRLALTLLIVSGTALAAIVVSAVLLVVRGAPAEDNPAPGTSATPVTTPMATAPSPMPPAPSPPPPSPPPPPPPPPPEPSTMNEAPAVVRPTVQPRPPKAPEINVTRTPQTREPISVAPQPRRTR